MKKFKVLYKTEYNYRQATVLAGSQDEVHKMIQKEHPEVTVEILDSTESEKSMILESSFVESIDKMDKAELVEAFKQLYKAA